MSERFLAVRFSAVLERWNFCESGIRSMALIVSHISDSAWLRTSICSASCPHHQYRLGDDHHLDSIRFLWIHWRPSTWVSHVRRRNIESGSFFRTDDKARSNAGGIDALGPSWVLKVLAVFEISRYDLSWSIVSDMIGLVEGQQLCIESSVTKALIQSI